MAVPVLVAVEVPNTSSVVGVSAASPAANAAKFRVAIVNDLLVTADWDRMLMRLPDAIFTGTIIFNAVALPTAMSGMTTTSLPAAPTPMSMRVALFWAAVAIPETKNAKSVVSVVVDAIACAQAPLVLVLAEAVTVIVPVFELLAVTCGPAKNGIFRKSGVEPRYPFCKSGILFMGLL
jgi:hypothetical protein